MPVRFNLSSTCRSSDNMKRVTNSHERKTYVYPNRKSELNFDEMYDDLNPNVAQLVEENRIKLNSMNSVRSKMLVNTTQMKLVAFMRSKPLSRKHNTISSTQIISRSNKNWKQEEQKENPQKIFDFNKLQQIVKSYEIKPVKCRVQFRGVLTEKVLKLTGQRFYTKPDTPKIDLEANMEQTQRSRNYQGWKTEKSRRRLKHMFA